MNPPPFPANRADEILSGWSEAERDSLAAAVDDSDHSLADWLEALAAFVAWLEKRGETRRPWREMTGYIHCCSSYAPAGIPLGNLKTIVFQALTEFGFRLIDESQD